jgi:aryl-alcohol dehydrogenase-like predicted oxidoreductase
MAQWALRWILMNDAVTTTIPGARNVAQAAENAAAGDLRPFSEKELEAVRGIYDQEIRATVHGQW